MNKLHSLAIYALVAPALTLSSGALLAEQSTDRGRDAGQYESQRGDDHQGAGGQMQREGDRQSTRDQSQTQGQDYMSSVPSQGTQASDLIGADILTSNDESVGSVDDLIIDADGQVVAVIVGVGGFLGMGQKDVALGWDHVTRSGSSDDLELRIDMTRDELRSAPKFERRD